jgi:hypothetical protein
LANGSDTTRQRVLRILLTNQGDYLWALSYGAGLPAQVGETTSARAIEASVRRQLLTEVGIASQPPPTVKVTPIFGGCIVAVSYRDRATGLQSQVGITVER